MLVSLVYIDDVYGAFVNKYIKNTAAIFQGELLTNFVKIMHAYLENKSIQTSLI